MVSISWYLPGKVWIEMSKTQHFEICEKVIFSELTENPYTYAYIFEAMGTLRERRENFGLGFRV